MDDTKDIKQQLSEIIEHTKEYVETQYLDSSEASERAKKLSDDEWVIKFYSRSRFALSPPNEDFDFFYVVGDELIIPYVKDKVIEWDELIYAGMLVIEDALAMLNIDLSGKKYTRQGMLDRVLEERRVKAKNANYKIKWAKNLYGEHLLTNEIGKTYKVTIHDLEKKIGYIDNIDWQTNKLGTTKHIIYLCNQLNDRLAKRKRFSKKFPFVDIYLNPQKDYALSWFYPHTLTGHAKRIIETYFGNNQMLADDEINKMQLLLSEIELDDFFKIRSEVYDKIERLADDQMLKIIEVSQIPDFSVVKADLYTYQKEGVAFALFKKAAIIADEMGLGKTLQAIAIAILKKQIFGFSKCAIICPASIKHQWKREIEKFSDEEAMVIEGFPDHRAEQYMNEDHYFSILNYETVLRDVIPMNKAGFDLIILDEAQRIKNYETKTATAIKRLKKQHGLVLTGTPIENKLSDLYSIMLFLDLHFLSPLWEFSYQHCVFDHNAKNKISGYYNLNNLNARLQHILIRREKRQVLDDLPNVVQQDIPVRMSQEQGEYHASFGKGVALILRKRYKTTYDWRRLMLLLNSMRMVADSTYLIDKETNISPKLEELRHILIEKIDIKKNNRKIIIFSEWINMLKLIEEVLLDLDIGYVVLTGKVPVKKRYKLIEEFEQNDDCKVFLSTEAGGTGLNLQMADTVINFELPWNPAKKNQRIGRIDRIGQKHGKLAVFNLISVNSIEMKIASGLELKQNLFEGVLNKSNEVDSIDFSNKGRAQFIKELEEYFRTLEEKDSVEVIEETEDNLDEDISIHEDIVIIDEEQLEEDLTDDQRSTHGDQSTSPVVDDTVNNSPLSSQQVPYEPSPEEVKKVFGKGLEFLCGMYKMSTGKEMDIGDDAVKINEETGELTFSLKYK